AGSAQIAVDVEGAAIAFGLGVADADQAEIGEFLGAGLGMTGFDRGLRVGGVEVLDVAPGEEDGEALAAPGDLGRAVMALRRDEARRVRLLPGLRPDVDLPVVIELALEVERPVARRERLEDEVVALPEALHVAPGIAVGGGELVGRALDQAD